MENETLWKDSPDAMDIQGAIKCMNSTQEIASASKSIASSLRFAKGSPLPLKALSERAMT